MKSCFQFCAESPVQHRSEIEPWNEVIYESPNFVALPTRGALVEGWLLIAPRVRYFCVGAFTSELLAELQSFRRDVQGAVQTVYGGSVAFEHGPAVSRRPAGCGVDHAHVHIVPWHGTFADAVQKYGNPQFLWRRVKGCEGLKEIHERGEDYLFFEETDGDAFATAGPIPSQYFRRVVAAAVGTPELSDWKLHSGIANVQGTLAVLRSTGSRIISA